MKCSKLQELLPDLAAGRSAAPPEMNEHIGACPACASKLEDMRKTMALLDEWQAPEPSPYFDVRLQSRLREQIAQERVGWWQWIRKPALALALTLLMAVGLTFVGRGHKLVGDQPTDVSILRPTAPPGPALPGTAVGDLQALDKNHELYADFDVLDDLEVQGNVTANP